jgi:hypothetical protein
MQRMRKRLRTNAIEHEIDILDGALDRRGRVINDPTFSDDFVPNLVSTMFVEAISWWLEQGRPYTPKEIATRCALLASALFKEASSWQ